MPKARTSNPETAKPPTPTEQAAAQKSTEDGLQKTRGNTQTRAEISQQKTPQGQSNRG
jgi:hypothetical protein